MIYSHEVQHMCVVKKGPNHGPAPIPEEGKWVRSKEIKDISGLTHGIGWCGLQIDPKHQGRDYRRSIDRDNRLFWNDSLRGYGLRDFTG